MLPALRLTSGLFQYNNTMVYIVTCRPEAFTASNFDGVSSNVAVHGVISPEILTQRSANPGPQAKFGPRRIFEWPA